jgi:hypothetical protein
MESDREVESFRDRNRRRREENAFENLLAYARQNGIRDPRGSAERAARSIHGTEPLSPKSGSKSAGRGRTGDRTGSPDAPSVPHRLEDRTKEQLYSRAQDLEIEGRSQMTKDELIQAIRESQ